MESRLNQKRIFVDFATRTTVNPFYNLHSMDPLLGPSPPRECSHSSCHRTIPATEAGVKQPRTCAECRAQDNASKKRKREREKGLDSSDDEVANVSDTDILISFIFTYKL